MAPQAPPARPRPAPASPDVDTLTPPAYETPAGMARAQFAAMGTTVTLLLPDDRAARGGDAVRALFTSWEGTLSRFHSDSELSRLNAHAGEEVAVGPLLYEVVAAALSAAQATEGLFDPTLLRQIVAYGYDRSFDALPARLRALAAVPGVGGGWRYIALDPVRRHIALPAGVGLDLGGIAKGMAVDAALTRLAALGIADAVVNAGGDLAARGLPPHQRAWSVAVPGRDHHWTIPFHHGALATSGVARRRWRQGDAQRHHLLDPRTGKPAASGLWSVTVAAGRCAQAEVAAKAALILGADAGARFIAERGLAGLLVAEDGSWRTAGPWPAMGDGDKGGVA